MSISYPSNLSDVEWECLQRHLPPSPKRGRPPTHPLRAIFDAIFYVLRTGCPWRYLPANFPSWQTVFYHFRGYRLRGTWTLLLRTLHQAERERQGRHPHPSAAIMDAPSASRRSRNRLASAALMRTSMSKGANGTCWSIHSVYRSPFTLRGLMGMTPEGHAACWQDCNTRVPRLKKIWADAAYRGQA
jgi:putative transposase